MQVQDLAILIKETMQITPVHDGEKLIFTKVGTFSVPGISKMEVVWNTKYESITTTYAEEGINVVRWNDLAKLFEGFNGNAWFEYTHNS